MENYTKLKYKQTVLLIGLIFLLHINTIAQKNNSTSSNVVNRIGETVKDEDGNILYRIEESSKYGYVYNLSLRSNSILTDSLSGLQWRRKPRAGFYETKHSWYDTQAWINEIQDGWRLPTLKELQELYDHHYRWFAIVWSSEEHETNKNVAYIFNMSEGSSKDFNGTVIKSTARKDMDIGEMMNCTPLAVREAKQKQLSNFALKVTPLTTDIKPDGKTTVKISAQLYSFIPGDNSSSKPLAGKTLSFDIQEMDGIKPGKLSSAIAVTDANGMATVIYTAPTAELLEKMQAFNRISTAVTIRNEEAGVQDLAYITFQTDKGKIWVQPGIGVMPDKGFVPPDKRYPASVTANFYEGNQEPIANTEVTFSIKESNPVGMLRSSDGREGKQIALKTDANGAASVQYYYAADKPPEKPITETIEAKTKNMAIPFKAYVSTGFNIVLENAESISEGKEVNAFEEVPLKVSVKDEWNPNFDLAEMITYWGMGKETGESKLNVKLTIEKQGFVPNFMLDLMGEQNHPEPLYEELLIPRNMNGAKNLLYIPEYSLKKKGFPIVKPKFSGNNNYEIKVSLVDEKGAKVFESLHPRAVAYISIPTGLAADAFSIWFASNPLGPHTEEARFFRMLLGTISFGNYGGVGAVISLADAAFAINKGDSEALANIMLAEIKNKVLGDASEKTGLSAERIGIYNSMAIAEQYVSFALTTHSDKGLIAQMENKILSGLASAGFGGDNKMIVLKGDGNQKLLIEGGQKSESNVSKALKDNFKIKISGLDKNTKDLFEKVGEKVGEKLKENGKEIPLKEGKYTYDEDLKTVSLKNGNVSIYIIPADVKVVNENAVEMKIY